MTSTKHQTHFFLTCAFAAASSLLFTASSNAIVINGGTQGIAPLNNTAPTDDPGWNRVGSLGNPNSLAPATGVYLGNGWILTTNHSPGSAGINLNDKHYNAITGTGRRLTNSDGSLTDLYITQIDVDITDPIASLPLIGFADSAPQPGDTGIMIGNGFIQTSQIPNTHYRNTPFPDGYTISTTDKEKRWATACIDNNLNITNSPQNIQEYFFTTFKENVINSGQVVNKDSGSSLFIKNNQGEWVLAGLAHSIFPYPNQPYFTEAIFGNMALWSDLSAYADQITAIASVPEPSSLLLLLGLPALFIVRKK